jgi:hypothetical protein
VYVATMGQAAVFIQHHDEPWPVLYLSDTLIRERPVTLTKPPSFQGMGMHLVGENTLVNDEEARWVLLCWSASQFVRDEFLDELKKLKADDDITPEGLRILRAITKGTSSCTG